MPLDSIFLTALTGELNRDLRGARIDRVNQPSRDTVVLSVRGPSADGRLLLCSGTGSARIGMTSERPENPAAPPMFCMLLRKHLTGARITAFEQPPFERLVRIRLDALDALGSPVRRELVCELMGRSANVILLDGDGIILDSLRRVDDDASSRRPVLPGLRYRLPSVPDRLFPDALDEAGMETLLRGAPEGASLSDVLIRSTTGLSPLLWREMCVRAYGDTEFSARNALRRDGGISLSLVLGSLLSDAREGRLTPTMLLDGDVPADFTVFPLLQYGPSAVCRTCGSFSELLDEFYSRRDIRERMRQRFSSLTRLVKTARDRTVRRLAAQRQDLLRTENREEKRICGDLLTANLWRMERGMREIRVEDFYLEGSPERTIPLDPRKTPQQNAAAYYKEYTKAKNAAAVLAGLIQSGEAEQTYLESVLDELDRATGERDLQEIRAELIAAGYEKPRKGEKQKSAGAAPLRFRTSTGYLVRAGRSNVQNDRLTLKESSKTDLWLHVKGIHGSHVVVSLEGHAPDDVTLREAASLAAYFSQGREASSVPVDYALVRYVKKPAGAKPGMVIYTDYKTVAARPDPALAESLREK